MRAGVYSDDGYIDPHRFIVGLGALQAGLILLHRHLKILRIDFGNQGAGLHVLILFDIDPDHLPGNPGADLDQVTIHLCVIGVFVIRGVPPEEQRAHDKNSDHADDDKPAPPLFSGRAIQVLILRIVLASLRTLFDGTLHGLIPDSVPPPLLSSHVILVIRLRDAQCPGEREFRHVVLVQAGDILVIRLGHRCLGLRYRKIVGNARRVALLRLAQSLGCQFYVAARNGNLLGGRLYIENTVAHVGADLTAQVVQLCLFLFQLRLRILRIAPQLGLFEERHGGRAHGVEGSVGVAQGRPNHPVIA